MRSQILLQGRSGSGKTTAAASWIRARPPGSAQRLLALMLDRPGKETPLILASSGGVLLDETLPDETRRILAGSEDAPDLEVLCFYETRPRAPTAWTRLVSVLESLDWSQYHTLVIDSLTSLRLLAEYAVISEYGFAWKKDKYPIYDNASERLVALLLLEATAWPVELIVTCHCVPGGTYGKALAEDGTALWLPDLAGRLGNTDLLARSFAETYTLHRQEDETGTAAHVFQTQSGGGWLCSTQWGVTDRSPAVWESVRDARLRAKLRRKPQ